MNGLISVWVGAQARSDSNKPADVLWDCPTYDPSAWPGHPLDTHPVGRSDLIGACLTQARRCLVRRPAGAVPPQTTIKRRDDSDQFGTEHHRRGRYALDVHVAAALDERGTLLGVKSFATTESGYKFLLGWLSGFGPVELVGVEGTGSYGAGLTRHLQAERIRVVEVDRPNRQRRRLKGKSDPQDAISAARAALSGDASGEAKARDGNVESMRVLRVARASARKGRTQAFNQMRNLASTPRPIRADSAASHLLLLSTRGQARHRLAHQVQPSDVGPASHHPRRGDHRDRRHPQAPGQRDRSRTRGQLSASGPTPPQRSSSRPATIPNDFVTRRPSPISAAPHHSTQTAARTNDTGSTAVVIARPTPPSGTS